MDARMLDKLEKISEKINEIDKTLVRNTDSLEHHIKRTDLLEDMIKPVQKHVLMVEATLKIIGSAGVITTFLGVMYKLFKFII